jgi:hypothetical protein
MVARSLRLGWGVGGLSHGGLMEQSQEESFLPSGNASNGAAESVHRLLME